MISKSQYETRLKKWGLRTYSKRSEHSPSLTIGRSKNDEIQLCGNRGVLQPVRSRRAANRPHNITRVLSGESQGALLLSPLNNEISSARVKTRFVVFKFVFTFSRVLLSELGPIGQNVDYKEQSNGLPIMRPYDARPSSLLELQQTTRIGRHPLHQ